MNAMSARLALLERILEGSVVMVEGARAGRWDDLPDLENQRAQWTAAYRRLAAGRDHDDVPDAEADLLTRIIEVNDVIAELAETYRKQLADMLAGSGRQRRAAGAYSEHSGPPSPLVV